MKVKHKRAACLSTALAVALAATACGGGGSSANKQAGGNEAAQNATSSALDCDEQISEEQALDFEVPKADEPYKVTLMLISLAGYYYQSQAYGAEQAAKEAGVELDLVASEGFSTAAQQVTQAQNALTKGTDAIVLGPVDVNGSAPVVTAAKQQKVPVVTIGTFVNSPDTAAQVVQDDYMQGRAAAKAVGDALPDGGEGIVQGGPANATWSSGRVEGFEDEIEENYPNIKINAVTHEDVDPNAGLTQFQNAVASHPQVDWIYTVYNLLLPPSSVPAQYADAVYVGGGYEPTTWDAVAAGKATVIPDWGVSMGRIGVAKAVAALNGDTLPALSCIPSPVITQDDVDSPLANGQRFPEGFEAK